jgi:carbon storage regulator
MLVLRRKPGERVYLGEDIEVVVLEVQGGRVRLGFTAPDCLPIQRGELLLHRDREGWLPALAEAECA